MSDGPEFRVMPNQPSSAEDVQQAYDYLMVLGNISVQFARVNRALRYPDGKRETDVEHSFHLALSATELAANYYPSLDVGLVSQFCLVHDFPEVYTGDVWTFNISDEDRAKKEAAEQQAAARLVQELPPYHAQLLERYELQQEPEARFVRFVDKLLPALINTVVGKDSRFQEDHGMNSAAEVLEKRAERTAKLQAMFPEFPFIHMLRDVVSRASTEALFPGELQAQAE